jgi:hypothetical protein
METMTIQTNVLNIQEMMRAVDEVVTPFSLDEQASAMVKGVGIKACIRKVPFVLIFTSQQLEGGMQTGNSCMAWVLENENQEGEHFVIAIQKPAH